MVNLIERLPALMQKYDEIIKITDSQNPEFDLIWAVQEWMRRNLYITTAEEYGLRRYERLLGITPLEGESYKARRNHILTRWNQKTPYTMRFLIGLLEMLTDGNFEIIPNFDKYEMEIQVSTLDSGIISDLAFILRYIIPANISLTSSNNITIDIDGGFINFAGALSTTRQYTITQDFNAQHSITGRLNQASAMMKTKTHTITQDFNAQHSITGRLNQASAMMKTKTHTITQDFRAEVTAEARVAPAASVVRVIEYEI